MKRRNVRTRQWNALLRRQLKHHPHWLVPHAYSAYWNREARRKNRAGRAR